MHIYNRTSPPLLLSLSAPPSCDPLRILACRCTQRRRYGSSRNTKRQYDGAASQIARVDEEGGGGRLGRAQRGPAYVSKPLGNESGLSLTLNIDGNRLQ